MTFRPNKRLVWICGLSMVAVIILLTAAAFILPAYVQSRVIPRLAAGFGLEPRDVHVRRIGLWGTDLGPVRLDARHVPALTLAAVQIDYTPWSLLRGRIEGITLGGVGLALTAAGDGLFIAGQQVLPAREPAAPKTGPPADLETLLPIQLGHVTLMQSHVDLDWNGRRIIVPLDIRMETAELGRGVLRGRVELIFLGNTVRMDVALDQRANSASVNIECDRFGLESLSQIGMLPADLKVAGVLGLKGRATLRMNPLTLTGLEITGRLSEVRLATPRGTLENMGTAQGGSQPIDLSISAQAADRIQYACGPFQLDGPVKTEVTTINGEAVRSDPGWSLNARVETLVPGQTLTGGLALENALSMSWQIEAIQGPEDAIGFKVRSAGTQPVAVNMQALQSVVDGCQVDLTGRYAHGGLEAEAGLSTGGVRVGIPDGSIVVTGIKVNGTVAVAPPASPLPSKMTIRAVLGEVRSEKGGAMITLPDIQVQAEGQAVPFGPWVFQGRLSSMRGHMQDKAHALVLQGLDLNLPLQWPPADKTRAGRLELRTIQWKEFQLGGVKGTLQQNAASLEMNFEHHSRLFTGLSVLVAGRLNAQEGLHAELRIPAYQPAQPVDLGRFSPATAGMQAGGRVEVLGTLDIVNGDPRGRAELKIDQGTVAQEERNLRLEGIGMALQINDIITLKSAPHQKLRVEKMQFGELVAQNLDVDFQLEDRRTFFLEKLGLQWCRGRINTAAIRIVQGKDDYDVTLFCDRLNLAMVLEQLGAAEAGGEGTVNGRIPLRWVNGRLSFDNGFLFSTPGQPGQIQVKGTEALLAGMPPGSPQHTQLDIATEALKDYTYQWAKLSVQSEKDVLLLKLQLDGKPNQLLPFAYDQQLGQFKRIAGEGQAEFKGISIDLNFKSPLNEIIHYKEFLNRK